MIDTTTAFANLTVLEKDQKAATADLSVPYLRPVFEGTSTCTAKVVTAEKRLSTI